MGYKTRTGLRILPESGPHGNAQTPGSGRLCPGRPRGTPRRVRTPSELVSALLPVRDAAATLPAALASLQVQSRPLDQIVVVDDGSSDSTGTVARVAASRDRRIEVLTLPPEGLVSALNAGLARCSGDWILRMDADDLSHRRRLEGQLEIARQNPDLDVIGCQVRIFPRRQRLGGYRRYEDWLNGLLTHQEMVREIFVESPLAHPSVLLRRTTLAAAGGWEDRGWPEDYDLWLRLVGQGAHLGKAPEPLFLWRDHPGRLSRRDPRYRRLAFLQAKAHHLARGFLAGQPRLIIWGAGRVGGQLARLLEAEGRTVEVFVDVDPARTGGCRRGRPVIAPEEVPRYRDLPILAAVGSWGARQEIRARLRALGLHEGRDFIAVA